MRKPETTAPGRMGSLVAATDRIIRRHWEEAARYRSEVTRVVMIG